MRFSPSNGSSLGHLQASAAWGCCSFSTNPSDALGSFPILLHYHKHFIYASLLEPSASPSSDRGGVLGEGRDSPGSLGRTREKGTVPSSLARAADSAVLPRDAESKEPQAAALPRGARPRRGRIHTSPTARSSGPAPGTPAQSRPGTGSFPSSSRGRKFARRSPGNQLTHARGPAFGHFTIPNTVCHR